MWRGIVEMRTDLFGCARSSVVEGRPRKTGGHRLEMDQWPKGSRHTCDGSPLCGASIAFGLNGGLLLKREIAIIIVIRLCAHDQNGSVTFCASSAPWNRRRGLDSSRNREWRRFAP
jgi:hypothetical protein